MLHELSAIDVAVLLVYLATVVALGFYFPRSLRERILLNSLRGGYF